VRIPELLFSLTRPKDLAQQQFQIVRRFAQLSSANDFNLGVYNVPGDQAFIVTQLVANARQAVQPGAYLRDMSFRSDTGAIGSISDHRFWAKRPLNPYRQMSSQTEAELAVNDWEAANFSGSFDGEHWCPPGTRISVAVNFLKTSDGAGALAQMQVSAWLTGILIPRANVTEA